MENASKLADGPRLNRLRLALGYGARGVAHPFHERDQLPVRSDHHEETDTGGAVVPVRREGGRGRAAAPKNSSETKMIPSKRTCSVPIHLAGRCQGTGQVQQGRHV